MPILLLAQRGDLLLQLSSRERGRARFARVARVQRRRVFAQTRIGPRDQFDQRQTLALVRLLGAVIFGK